MALCHWCDQCQPVPTFSELFWILKKVGRNGETGWREILFSEWNSEHIWIDCCPSVVCSDRSVVQ